MFVAIINDRLFLGVEKIDLENLSNDIGFVGGEIPTGPVPHGGPGSLAPPKATGRAAIFFAKNKQEFETKVELLVRGENGTPVEFFKGQFKGQWRTDN